MELGWVFNATTANPQVPPSFDQGQGHSNPNIYVQALPQGFPLGLGFPHFSCPDAVHEFGAQRGVPAQLPTYQQRQCQATVPTIPFVNAQEAAAITRAEEHLMQHLCSQGLTTDDAENIRRSTLAGR